MQATRVLHDMGQSFWLDTITGNLLARGTPRRSPVLPRNPTIFDNAISRSNSYDAEIRRLVGRGLTGETLLFEPRYPGSRLSSGLVCAHS
jgi:transaldolase